MVRRPLGVTVLAGLPFLIAPPPAKAQAETRRLDELKIDLWPEYDRPSALVMYRFRLKAGVDLSLPVAIPVPAHVGEPHAVAWKNDRGSLIVAQFSRRTEGDRQLVLARLGSREGQLEFYADIEIADRKRSFRFAWPGGVDLGSLSFQIQRPLGASGLRVFPAPSREWVGEDGLSYALVELGPQGASATPAIEIAYEKEGTALSAPAPPPAFAAATPKASPMPWWVIAAGGVVLGFLVAATLYARQAAKEPQPNPRSPADTHRPIYCPECGTKGLGTDTFCMSCGARLPRPQASRGGSTPSPLC
jgi:hypothetical protein